MSDKKKQRSVPKGESKAKDERRPREDCRVVPKGEIKELIELLQGTDVSEIEVETEGRRIRIRRGSQAVFMDEVEAPGRSTVTREAPAASAAVEPVRAQEETGVLVKSPIVGSFYRSPSPEAPPFVELGSDVHKGQVLCIIEAMKLMNEIESEVDGRVKKVLAETGQPVEYGQPLFLIEPA